MNYDHRIVRCNHYQFIIEITMDDSIIMIPGKTEKGEFVRINVGHKGFIH